MNKLQCPGCKSDHITIHSRSRYFSWAALCLGIVSLSYLIIRTPMLKPGEWNGALIALSILSETAFCISIIMAVYYIILGILKRHASYTCKNCQHDFDTHSYISHISTGSEEL
jgi:hypothetical protein